MLFDIKLFWFLTEMCGKRLIYCKLNTFGETVFFFFKKVFIYIHANYSGIEIDLQHISGTYYDFVFSNQVFKVEIVFNET